MICFRLLQLSTEKDYDWQISGVSFWVYCVQAFLQKHVSQHRRSYAMRLSQLRINCPSAPLPILFSHPLSSQSPVLFLRT